MKNIIQNKKVLVFLVSFCSSLYATENHLEFAFVQTSGNTDSTIVSGKYKTKQDLTSKDIFKLEANILYNKNEENTSANKYSLETDYNRLLSEKLYSYFGFDYIKDELSEYDYRINVGPGYGYKVLNDNIHKLDLEAGIDYAYDNYSYTSNEWYLAGKTKLDYSYQINYNTKLTQMLSYLLSLKTAGRYFASSETSIQTKMVKDFSLAFTYRLDYANESRNDENLDKKALASVIYDF